ncbi:fasciclin-like arabinogalactan protein 12 [Senna tora]|uniref:Fasciclin-like arabinogalactan protein 12 n=1 Tax=Senna tora TaxID=362788 RepID=A0A834W1A3_9FABA|nr:fasciclin-like arabinogalactan protein 12 [Senna tora]
MLRNHVLATHLTSDIRNLSVLPSFPSNSQVATLSPSNPITSVSYDAPPLSQSPAAAPAPSPSTPPTDIIRILNKAGGFTTLIRLLKTTQVANQINSQLLNSNGGITLFAPSDNAFSSLKPGFLNSLNDQQKNELIQFHMLPNFVALSNFDTLSNPVRTQAGADPDRLALNVTGAGNQVNMTTGVVNTTVGGTVYSDNQLAVYQVDKVLLPRDFFEAKPPAPAPAPEKSKSSKKKSAEGPASPADVSGGVSLRQRNGMWEGIVGVAAIMAFWL